MADPFIKLRPWSESPFWRDDIRLQVWSWARRSGKSFTMAARAMRLNMENPGNLNAYLSANLRLGGEFLLKEATVWQQVLNAWRKAIGAERVQSNIDGLTLEDAADVFEHNKFETRVYHSSTTYSRSVVLPANTQSVGYGGNLFIDEFGRIPDFKDVLEAAMPFLDDNPTLTCIMASTPPPDDAHYSFELTVPPDNDFPVNPAGNWYVSRAGFNVHRVDVWDREAAGFHMHHPITGKPCTPDEHRAASFDKQAWDRNYAMKYLSGGTSAVSLVHLANAQAIGQGMCMAQDVTDQLRAS